MTNPDRDPLNRIAAETEHAEATRDVDLPHRRRIHGTHSVCGERDHDGPRVSPPFTNWHELPLPANSPDEISADGVSVAEELAAMREEERY